MVIRRPRVNVTNLCIRILLLPKAGTIGPALQGTVLRFGPPEPSSAALPPVFSNVRCIYTLTRSRREDGTITFVLVMRANRFAQLAMASPMGTKIAPSHPDFHLSLILAEGALTKIIRGYIRKASHRPLQGSLCSLSATVAPRPQSCTSVHLSKIAALMTKWSSSALLLAPVVQNEFTQNPAGAAERTTYSQQRSQLRN